ncbi:hypothetical protein [Halobaculum litoreum]|nr:hypothetical protein [Halobaculum sp. DT92]
MAAADVILVTELLDSSADLLYLTVGTAGRLTTIELFGSDVVGGDT